MNLSVLFSILYFTGFIISLVIGLIVISADEKKPLNRLFFLICLALCLWLFSFSYDSLQNDLSIVLKWRRFSVLGWGMINAYILRYTLLLTQRKKFAQNTWVRLLIYLPALIVVFAFGISPLSQKQYNLVQTFSGWVNISVNNTWDWFFYTYLAVYLLTSIILLLNWQRKMDSPNEKKQVGRLVAATVIATVLGAFTDFIINAHATTGLCVPQISPLLALIPVTSIFYSITNNGLLTSEDNETELPDEILSEPNTIKYYRVVSLSFFMGAITEYITNIYFLKNQLSNSLSGTLFFAVGVIIWALPIYVKNKKVRDAIFIIVVSLSTPIITVLFDSGTSLTTWAIPAVLVLISIIYNKKYLIFSVGASIIFTQIYVWIESPQVTVQINSGEYAERVLFFLIFMFAAFYVRRTYLNRLNKIESKIVLQRFVLYVTKELTAANEENINAKISDMLKISGKYINADRAFIYTYSNNKVVYEWCDTGTAKLAGFCHFYESLVSGTIRPKGYNKIIKIPRAEVIINENGEKEVSLDGNNIKSMFAIPMTLENKTIGLICYATSGRFSIWEKPDQDVVEILVNIAADTISRIKAEKYVNHLAYHDSLTDLPNKTAFDKFAEENLQPVKTVNRAILLVNYENFKLVNLTRGYDYANGIIKTAAEKLSVLDDDNFKLFHVSIDRFVFCVRDYNSKADLEKMCESTVAILQSSISERPIICNIGAVELPKSGLDGDTLLKYATIAANSVTGSNSRGYSFFSDYMGEELYRKSQIGSEIKSIIEEGANSGSFYLEYQPIIDLKTDRIVSFEALARMRSSKLGKVSPFEFIQAAEDSCQIYALGKIVLHKAFAFLNQLASIGRPDIILCVNISALQLLRDSFLPDLFELMEKYKIDPSALDLELTESVFSEDFITLNTKLEALRSKGIHISIDDFGTGYSSFARERDLSVDCIKIDKHFIDKLLEIKPEQAVTGDIISMAHKLGHSVVAEGVETIEQKQYLIEHNCDYMQGYLFSKPVPQEQAIAML